MKKSSKKQQGGAGTESRPEKVVGLDLGDRYSHYCMLTGSGEVMEEGRIQTNAAALEKHFGTEPRMRIALEAGTHSGWVSRLLKSYGHQQPVQPVHKPTKIIWPLRPWIRSLSHFPAEKSARDPAFPPGPDSLFAPVLFHQLMKLRRRP
jgi:hypothetical protein